MDTKEEGTCTFYRKQHATILKHRREFSKECWLLVASLSPYWIDEVV